MSPYGAQCRTIAPLLALLGPLNQQIEDLDERVSELALKDERVKRLLTMPQIGPVMAVSFVATPDEVAVQGGTPDGGLPGLVPREWSSSVGGVADG